MDSISWFVDKYSNHEQTPIHDIHVLAASEQEPVIDVPDDVDISQTQQKQKSNITKKPEDTKSDKWKNELTNHLTTLRNTNIPFAKRLELEKRLSSLFANDAKVKYLAQESDMVIDKEDACDFLGFLATNPGGRIVKVIVEGGTFDSNNRIKVLKVRETFIK